MKLEYSKSEVNKAGNIIREFFAGPIDEQPEGLRWAAEVAWQFRACHQYPLQKVTAGIRSMVSGETDQIVVAQRLKRFPSMLNKLTRHPDMALARMQDIGGCRAILRNGGEVQRVLKRVKKNWRPPENRIRDYTAHPADSGYRGIHVITMRDDRLIEIQLRTPMQHEWAIAVERMGARTKFDLKSGVGPPALLDFFRVISEGMAHEEAGETPGDEFFSRYDEARAAAAEWLGGGAR